MITTPFYTKDVFALLSLCVFSLFTIFILSAIKKEKIRRVFVILFVLLLFAVGYKNFNYNFLHPLRNEYSAIGQPSFF
ncbi:MAG TPA: hypothetical protein VJ111_09780 [Chitinophagaceae bacterium]|nr:hypothetical protein [Chitinophagaceae bacterium]